MQKRRNKISREYLLVFILAALPKIWIALQAFPLKTFSDELATMASAASLAGFDWSAVVSRAGYYGAGFFWIFAPVFKLTDHPVLIYRTILVGCSLTQACIAPICYYIMERYFPVLDQKYRFMSSIACSYLVMTRATLLFNEHILVLLVWLIALCLLKIHEYQETPVKKRIYTGLLLFILAYSLTIHTRMITLWIALFLFMIGYAILYRRYFLSKSISLLVGCGGYCIAMHVVKKVQESLWNTGNGGELRNAAVSISFGMNWFSLRTWKAWLSIVIGQLNTINLVTGGLVIVILFLMFFFVKNWILKRIKHDSVTVKEENYVILIFFFLCCTVMTMGAQSITWLSGASEGISHGTRSMDYGLKAYTYLRYFGVYVGPLLMCGIAMFVDYGKKCSKAIAWSVPVSGLCLLGWLILIQPFVYENVYTSEFFTGISFFQTGEQFELRHYLIGILWMVVIGTFLYTFLLKGQLKKLVYLLTFYLIFQYCSNGMGYDISREKNNLTVADGGYKTVKLLEKQIKLPRQIYCYEGREKLDHQLYYAYQFYLNRYKIVPINLAEVKTIPEGKIVFSNSKEDKILLKKGYQCLNIDNNEYLYVDKKYENVLPEIQDMER